ncbi:MAG: peptidylprolyl isomerase [Desulfuromusa sp.]|nr:peptidylprolyl isomerase [Desulfuromusa sp.]
MLKPLALIYFAVATSLTLFFSAGTVLAESTIVAKIVDTPVTVYELNREMQRIMPMNSRFHGALSQEKISAVREKALNNLIDQGYKVQYALQQKISVSKSDLDKRLEKIHKKFPTKKALQKALGEEGLDDFYASVKRILLAKKAEEMAVGSKSKLSAAEIRNFYEKNKRMYNRPRQYRASVILIKVDPTRIATEKEPLRLKAEGLAERAKAGEDFHDLAYYNSDDRTKFVGGDIGYFHTGQIVKEIEDAIVDLKPGEIAGPVETRDGFNIIKLTELKEPKQLLFEEVKEKIRKRQEKKKYDILYTEWMAGLKKIYQHEVFPHELK